jgi:predicted nucleic-acid-binding Zn-ribbon protein
VLDNKDKVSLHYLKEDNNMKQCPKCKSTNIVKEEWRDTVTNAVEIGGSAAFGKTGDLKCVDCGYTSTPSSFEAQEDNK